MEVQNYRDAAYTGPGGEAQLTVSVDCHAIDVKDPG